LSFEDRIFIKNLWECKRFSARTELVQGTCGTNRPNPKQIATVLISFVSCTMGSPPPPKKSPRDSEWRISNYQRSKVKVSQSETRIQKWAN